MIGNDIIDIKETKLSTSWNRPRFIEKIFTLEEQELISNSTDPFTTVWHLWSMKESAYKVFIQANGDRFFNPKRIECTLDNLKTGQVKIGNSTLKTNTLTNSDYIFSTSTFDDTGIITRIFQLNQSNINYQSVFMHQQVLNDIATSNSLNGEELKIQKNKAGVPKVYYKNKQLNTFITITHHGNFGAYSILKN